MSQNYDNDSGNSGLDLTTVLDVVAQNRKHYNPMQTLQQQFEGNKQDCHKQIIYALADRIMALNGLL